MPRKVSDERKRFWRDLVERQPTSGLNIARFCADAGVSQNAFYVWKKRLLTTAQQDRNAKVKAPAVPAIDWATAEPKTKRKDEGRERRE